MGAADFVGVGVAGLVAVGFGVADTVGVGVGVGRGLGVGLGVGDAATTSGDGTNAGELATSALDAALLGGLTGLAMAEPGPEALVAVGGELTAEVDPAADGWLLVHAARAAAQSTATTQRAGVGLVVRSRLAIDPG